MKRKWISNRVRFEVLKRDDFSCHYCGAKPPDVRLEVDHIQPVAKGGSNDDGNLVAACERCNCGKRDISLNERLPPAMTIHEVRRRLFSHVFSAVISNDAYQLEVARMAAFRFEWCTVFGYTLEDGDVLSLEASGLPDRELVLQAMEVMSHAEIKGILTDAHTSHVLHKVRPSDRVNALLRKRLGKGATDELASN
jgi:hypothetical protein